MCSYQAWFHDENTGYVVECNRCNRIQMGFGNLMVTFTAADFESFRKYLAAAIEKRDPATDKKIKSIIIQTPSEGISFLLNEEELAGMHRMIEYVDTEMKTKSLISLFEG